MIMSRHFGALDRLPVERSSAHLANVPTGHEECVPENEASLGGMNLKLIFSQKHINAEIMTIKTDILNV